MLRPAFLFRAVTASCLALSINAVAASERTQMAQAVQLIEMLGGMMAAAQMQRAQELWRAEPELRRHCIERALARERLGLGNLIRAGIMPGDPRIGHITRECRRFEATSLRSNFRCTLTNERAEATQTWCMQAFVHADQRGGERQPLDPRAAIDLHFQGTPVTIAEIETDTGRRERHERGEARRRAAEIANLAGEIEPFRSSPSDVVRAQAQGILRRIAIASGPRAEPSQSEREAILQARWQLSELARAEEVRLGSFRVLDRAREGLERRVTATTPTELREEFEQIKTEHDAAVRDSRPIARPQPIPDIVPVDVRASFDCDTAKSPLGRVICSDKGLARLDLEMVQPYYVLRHLLPQEHGRLRGEAVENSRRVTERCRLPEPTMSSQASLRRAVECVRGEYQRQRDEWKAEVASLGTSARQETSRPIADHVQAQANLKTLGFLASSDRVDGVFGAASRSAITAFQSSEGIEPNGLMSDETYMRLASRTGAAGAAVQSVSVAGPSMDVRARITSIAERYQALSVKLDAHDQAEALARAATPRNLVLREGPSDDVIIIFNDTGRAPSAVKNLRGEVVFEGSRTFACQPHDGFTEIAVTRHLNALLNDRVPTLRFPLPRCDLARPDQYDLMVIERGALLQEKPADIVLLLSALETGVFAVLTTVTGSDVTAARQAEAVRVAEIEASIGSGARKGFGVIAMSNGSRVVCQAVVEQQAAHRQALGQWQRRMSEELGGPPTYVATTVEAAFISAKRGQCGALYADATGLNDLKVALARDDLAFRFLPIWVDAEDIDKTAKAQSEREIAAIQQEAERRRRAEDEKRLAAEKADEAAAVRARRQAELQQQNGALARAFEGALATEIKAFLEVFPKGSSLPPNAKLFAEKHPAIVQWYQKALDERWELMTIDTELVDYGVANFKGRSLEVATARTRVRMRNRILGEYRDHCMITGFIDDKEFAMQREPISVNCDDANVRLEQYKHENSFISRWLAP
jgi:hypothetical protein